MSNTIGFAHVTDLFEPSNILKSFREFSKTKLAQARKKPGFTISGKNNQVNNEEVS